MGDGVNQSGDIDRRLPQGLVAALRQRTQALHTEAERSGVINALLRGIGTRRGYLLLLRNLLPAYGELEAALDERRSFPLLAPLALPAVYRAPALRADLTELAGPDWAAAALPLLPAGVRYAARIAAAAEGSGEPLIAHAYARYLGDLNGGQILQRLVGRALDLPASSLRFYDFPAIPDLPAFRAAYRDSLDGLGPQLMDPARVLEAAAEAFRLNIDLSIEVQQVAMA